MTKTKIFEMVKKKNIQFIQFWFTDILGVHKFFTISPDELEGAIEEGMGFDGSSVEGFTRIEESDMIAKPDLSTFKLLPWDYDGFHIAMMVCDIYMPDGKPYPGCPRYILKQQIAKAKKMGFDFLTGPELEYFYFENSSSTKVLDKGGYFDLTPIDVGDDLRRETIFALEKLGVQVEYSHHEVAPSQHEIDLRFDEALRMADKTMLYKYVVKEVARRHGVYATFMPKPIYGQNGSGMHCHMSLFKGKKNAFFEKGDIYNLSDTAKKFIAGLLNHAAEYCAVTNQWVNSYKRLVPGYEAPVYISWAQRNRSALIRVPMYKPGKEIATRIELRSPDPAANPYLAFAVMLGAGLEGMEKKYKLGQPVTDDIYKMTDDERKEAGIDNLPGSLGQAIFNMETSAVVKKVLGKDCFGAFLRNKRAIWDEYRSCVTEYELEKYLPVL